MRSLSKKVVLLVEDDEADIELTRRAFTELGFDPRLETAGNGAAALDLLKGGLLPDLVVTDIKMPRGNGFDLARGMRADPRWKGIPVAFLTSSSEPRDRAEAESLGARGYFLKPMGMEGFREIVAALSGLLDGG